jgi:class 3 adenylate cyclase/tetratricopeptide (TPR) repeat protein
MELLAAYIPMDRRQAISRGEDLPDRMSGAALFADISNFTPLTEALVEELGRRRGADELTRQLNLVYETLIAEVHRYGGSVITFSGDAITCWFDGDDGLRATACALAMQRTMGQFAEVETPSGSAVSLAMKAAVATGPVRRFLVGNPQIQTMDVLAGAMLDRMAAAERQAERGEVVVEAWTISRLGDRVTIAEWREDTEAGERFAVVSGLKCQVKEAPWPTLPASALTEEQVREWFLPPIYERLRSGQGQFLAELRPAVALFVRFGGLDYDRDDAVGKKLDIYLRWVQNVLARYEGYMFQLTLGDKGCYLYGAFGAPLAHDDDRTRSVAAALELRSPPPEMDYITDVQIGISQGRMRAGAYGGSMRRTYGVLGDEVNLAARLMGRAEPGQILVSQRIADAVSQRYQLQDKGRITVKGRKEPLPVSVVSGRRLASPQRPASLFPHRLVGRNRELAQMEQVLESVLAGEGCILRLEGVAGVGKSHLAAEFVERAVQRGFRVALGACQSTSQDIAYYPWQQVFRALFELTDLDRSSQNLEFFEGEDPHGTPSGSATATTTSLTARQIAQVEATVTETNPGWLLRFPLLGDLLNLPIPDNATTATFSPHLRQESLLSLASEIVQVWAEDQPLLLLIEDAHWMDEASLGLTLALGRMAARAEVLLALIQRPPIHPDQPLLPDLNRLPHCRVMDLGELSSSGIAGLVINRLQGQPSALALDLIQAQAHGSPFFAEEFVDALRESEGLYRQEDGAWTLSEPIVNTLRGANCLVRKDGGWALAQDAQLSAVDLGIPDSIHGIVLSRTDRLPEAHKLTLKVASVIGRVFEFDLLARSYPIRSGREKLREQMGLLETRDFARLEMPPPRLTYMFKHNITQEVAYETLLEDQQRELHRAVGRALEALHPEAVERLAYHFYLSVTAPDKEVRKAIVDESTQADLTKAADYLLEAGAKARRLGQFNPAVENFKRAFSLLADSEAIDDRCKTADIARRIGRIYGWMAEYKRALGWMQRGLAQLEGVTRDEAARTAEAMLHIHTGSVRYLQGDSEEAVTSCHRGLDATGGIDIPQVSAEAHNLLGVIHDTKGDSDKALEYYAQSRSLWERANAPYQVARVDENIGTAYFFRDEWDEAAEYYERSLDFWEEIEDKDKIAYSCLNLGGVHLNQGELAKAETNFERALRLWTEVGNQSYLVIAHNNLGFCYIEAEAWGKARDHLESALDILRQSDSQNYLLAEVYCGLAECFLGLSNPEHALELGQRALGVCRELEPTPKLQEGFAHRAVGKVYHAQNDFERAEHYLTESLSKFEDLGSRFEGAKTAIQLALLCRDMGRSTEAKEYVEQALIAFEELGAKRRLERAKAIDLIPAEEV